MTPLVGLSGPCGGQAATKGVPTLVTGGIPKELPAEEECYSASGRSCNART